MSLHSGLSRSLGKESGMRAAIYTPAEALIVLHEEIFRLDSVSR